MAIVLDGTSGITNDSGYTGDGVSFADSTPANTLVTTDAGNVGIGTSSPVGKFEVIGATGATAFRSRIVGSTNNPLLDISHSEAGSFSQINAAGTTSAANNLVLATGGTERARIDSSGNFLFAKTATTATVRGSWFNTVGALVEDQPAGNVAVFFRNSSSGADVGAIVVNTSSTSYNTTSDYRLKEAVQPMTGALAKIAALNPVTYKWKADGSDGEGFIAHELQEVVPECVSGEKDAVDADGNPQYQGIDTSFLVATLTAAIQEQQAIITALTARVEALEGAQA